MRLASLAEIFSKDVDDSRVLCCFGSQCSCRASRVDRFSFSLSFRVVGTTPCCRQGTGSARVMTEGHGVATVAAPCIAGSSESPRPPKALLLNSTQRLFLHCRLPLSIHIPTPPRRILSYPPEMRILQSRIRVPSVSAVFTTVRIGSSSSACSYTDV